MFEMLQGGERIFTIHEFLDQNKAVIGNARSNKMHQVAIVIQVAQECHFLLEHAEVVVPWGNQLLDCHMLQKYYPSTNLQQM